MNEFGCKGTHFFAYMQEGMRFFEKKARAAHPLNSKTTGGKQHTRTKTEGSEVNRPTGGKQQDHRR